MKPVHFILMWLLAVPAMAATGHYAISPQQVAAAIAGMGVPVVPGQVSLLSDVVANTASPHLLVDSIQRWGASGMMARLQCESQEECLPFFVKLRLQDGTPQPVLTSAPQAAAAPVQAKPAARLLMRAGSPAVLLLDGPHVQIRVSVVCLDSGAMGQTVHAADPDHRQVYAAQVIAAGVLKGRL
jgi:hypothetical protein